MRLFQRFLAVGIVLIGMTSVALAKGDDKLDGRRKLKPSADSPAHAPEIDPRSATTALALLAGGLLMVRGRRRVSE